MKVDEEIHQRIDEEIAHWRQGDFVLGEHWLLFRLNTELPLSEEAQAAAQESADAGEAAVAGLVITTQTCDIVRSCRIRPYIEASPLVEVSPDAFEEIRKCRRPNYAHIPGVPEESYLVVDLDRTMTLEKAVLTKWQRSAGCPEDSDTRNLALALSRKRSRTAFPDDFMDVVKGLQNRISKKHDKDNDEGEALRALREIRVRATPSWDADEVQLFFWFLRSSIDEDNEAHDWAAQLDLWLDRLITTHRFKSIEGAIATLDDITARDYVESDQLDLDHLSG